MTPAAEDVAVPGSELLSRHRQALADTVTIGAYRAAIVRLVRAGDVVVDVGAGAGLRSIFCARAGARRVYAIERTPLVRLARELAAANDAAHLIEFVEAEPREVTLPEPADVLVSEWMGLMALHDNRLPELLDTRDRLLRPGGRMLPERVEVYVAPVEALEAWEQRVGVWLRSAYALDLSEVGQLSRHELHAAKLDARGLLAPAARVHVLDLAGAPAPGFEAQRYVVVEREGTLHGVAGWFDAHFAPDLCLSTSPQAPLTHWRHAFFPAPRPIPVTAGTRVGLIVEAIPAGPVVHWRLAVRLGDGPTTPAYRLDTRLGFVP